jgi:hypothetical protein
MKHIWGLINIIFQFIGVFFFKIIIGINNIINKSIIRTKKIKEIGMKFFIYIFLLIILFGVSYKYLETNLINSSIILVLMLVMLIIISFKKNIFKNINYFLIFIICPILIIGTNYIQNKTFIISNNIGVTDYYGEECLEIKDKEDKFCIKVIKNLKTSKNHSFNNEKGLNSFIVLGLLEVDDWSSKKISILNNSSDLYTKFKKCESKLLKNNFKIKFEKHFLKSNELPYFCKNNHYNLYLNESNIKTNIISYDINKLLYEGVDFNVKNKEVFNTVESLGCLCQTKQELLNEVKQYTDYKIKNFEILSYFFNVLFYLLKIIIFAILVISFFNIIFQKKESLELKIDFSKLIIILGYLFFSFSLIKNHSFDIKSILMFSASLFYFVPKFHSLLYFFFIYYFIKNNPIILHSNDLKSSFLFLNYSFFDINLLNLETNEIDKIKIYNSKLYNFHIDYKFYEKVENKNEENMNNLFNNKIIKLIKSNECDYFILKIEILKRKIYLFDIKNNKKIEVKLKDFIKNNIFKSCDIKYFLLKNINNEESLFNVDFVEKIINKTNDDLISCYENEKEKNKIEELTNNMFFSKELTNDSEYFHKIKINEKYYEINIKEEK